ncbi:LacI family DNA-binding transcriptional regulator [Cereibacter sphaeroides]|uniref:LacI family DNA-binding transcriptional regulator n=1 Tax=Cereibacter sphaeroides TaxID=1063 RepID=UPI001F425B7F|nr:LacI family DNA-binding transcriptional regulator [Cereibacter sphaeroides]MCE6962196.1 LacI family DNA-binding transcriptional regulator [Cereibacter sphaeroides]MCE6972434.1 LacI family DNA-binding transcriptional regulator [Cereibacter sphaeroides]
MARKVSMTDVAREAGVSVATVDRVLNGRGGVRPGKEEQILAASRRLGIDRALRHRPARTLRIAVMIQHPKNPFHAALREGIDLAARLHDDLNMQFQVRHIVVRDAAGIAAAIRSLDRICDGLIISSAEEPGLCAAIRELAARVPVVTLATDLADSGRAAYVGPDDHRAGRVAGDLMARLLGPEGGRVMMMAGLMDFSGQRAREAGFRKVVAEHHPACRLVTVIETGEDHAVAGRLAEVAMRNDPDLRGIYHTSVGALAIVETLERMGRRNRVEIITHELTPNRRMLLRERRISAVIDQKPLLEARLAVEAMARLHGRLPGLPASISTDIQIFMPENA